MDALCRELMDGNQVSKKILNQIWNEILKLNLNF